MTTDLREAAAVILAAIMTVPEPARLDALAIAIRAALDAKVVRYGC